MTIISYSIWLNTCNPQLTHESWIVFELLQGISPDEDPVVADVAVRVAGEVAADAAGDPLAEPQPDLSVVVGFYSEKQNPYIHLRLQCI